MIDFNCMPYKYKSEEDKEFNETTKANPDFVMHEKWPFNYLYAITQNNSGDKILLIP